MPDDVNIEDCLVSVYANLIRLQHYNFIGASEFDTFLIKNGYRPVWDYYLTNLPPKNEDELCGRNNNLDDDDRALAHLLNGLYANDKKMFFKFMKDLLPELYKNYQFPLDMFLVVEERMLTALNKLGYPENELNELAYHPN